jgi:hypothetical protein
LAPVSALMTTTGLSAACEAAGSSIAGAPVRRNASIVSRPGDLRDELRAGLKPSLKA